MRDTFESPDKKFNLDENEQEHEKISINKKSPFGVFRSPRAGSDQSPSGKLSFIMCELKELWNEIYINEALEDEIVRIIYKKLEARKEIKHQRIT